jgi:succinoglycan biosynthesis transport protein ExoP
MNLSNERGLSDVLVGLARFQDAVLPTEHARVFVLPSGRSAPNPVGLLQGESFERLLRQAREQYDYVLIDAPALRSIVDGVVLGIKAEGTVLIVSAAQSDGRSVRTAIEKLRAVDGINLLGVVLNATRPDRRETAANYYLGGGGQTIALPPEHSG